MARTYRRDARGRFAGGGTSRGRATSRLRPGELMNANARPVNTMARFRAQSSKFGTDRKANVDLFLSDAMKSGYFSNWKPSRVASKGNIAEVHSNQWQSSLSVNSRSRWFANPVREQRQLRRTGWLSTSDPRGLVAHEVAHAKGRHRGQAMWELGYTGLSMKIAGRVSRYARTNPHEFVAEVAAGLKTGRKYDHQVMKLYRGYTGQSPTPAARRRSRRR